MPVDTSFTLVSGTHTTEQDLLTQLDFFLVNTVGGWVNHKVVTDVATDKNIVYYTDGSTPAEHDRLWVRVRANSNYLSFNGLSNFDTDTDTDFDQFGGTANENELTVSASGTYWFMANHDAVHILVDRASDGESFHGGFGRLSSYYTTSEDPKPLYIFGQTSASSFSTSRLAAYAPRSWGDKYNTTHSGSSSEYLANHPAGITYGTPNPRSGYPKLVEPIFYSNELVGQKEVRGEVPGLYMCGGEGLTAGSVIDIDVMPPTVSGRYLIHKKTATLVWALGPTTVSGEP